MSVLNPYRQAHLDHLDEERLAQSLLNSLLALTLFHWRPRFAATLTSATIKFFRHHRKVLAILESQTLHF